MQGDPPNRTPNGLGGENSERRLMNDDNPARLFTCAAVSPGWSHNLVILNVHRIFLKLTRIINLEIMEDESSSESDGMDDFNSSSESDLHSNPSSSSEASSISDWDSESDVDCDGKDIYDLCSLLESLTRMGMPGSCHDVTCLWRSPLWRRMQHPGLFDDNQYLLGDSGYTPQERLSG
ncbi:hypothetical protein R1flu_016727 [Riccia fluitans]|uniref:DDE Tnp4 domain-containing protein n=1 Tax=Riccia fluitans TaxID=41844 RepID=A0ABD1YMN4_9MARC